MGKNDILNIKNLVVHYVTDDGVVKAVNGIDIDLKEKETLGSVGEMGAGKTTTALSILRLVPDPPGKIIDGEIYSEGENLPEKTIEEMRPIRGNNIAMICHDTTTSLKTVTT